MTGAWLLEICEIHLLYTGKHMYGELKPRTFQPRIGHTKGGVPCGGMNETDKATKDTPCTVVHNVINNMDTHSDASPSIFPVPVAVHSAQGTNIMDIIETTEVVAEIPRECCDQAPNTEAIVDVGSDTSCDITESSELETDMSEMAKDNDVSGINSTDKAKIQNVNSIVSESGSAAECIDDSIIVTSKHDIPGHHSLENTDDNPESGIAAECAIEDFNVAPKNDTTELKDIDDNPSMNNLPIPQERADLTGSSTMEMQCTMGTNNETVKSLKHSVLDKYSDGRLSGALEQINLNTLDLPYSLGGPTSENPASSTPSPTPICQYLEIINSRNHFHDNTYSLKEASRENQKRVVAEEPSSSDHDVSNNPSNSIELPVIEMEVLTYDQCMVDPSGYDVSLPVDIIENINQNVEIN